MYSCCAIKEMCLVNLFFLNIFSVVSSKSLFLSERPFGNNQQLKPSDGVVYTTGGSKSEIDGDTWLFISVGDQQIPPFLGLLNSGESDASPH